MNEIQTEKLKHEVSIKTYSHSKFMDFIIFFRKLLFSSKKNAQNAYSAYNYINELVKQRFNEELEDLNILDIGCGQRFPYTYLFSKNNSVIGIDLDIILLKHSFSLYKSIIKTNGLNRFIKTFLRSIFFDRSFFQNLRKIQNYSQKRQFHLLYMNAEKMEFSDNRFDFVFSYNAFEHIEHVDKVVKEIKRVLKPQGKFCISIDFYSRLNGGHKEDKNNLWNHLLDKNFQPNVYLNKLRLDDYISIFKKYFKKVYFICEEDENNKKILTQTIKKQLPEYSEKELIMKPLVVMGEK